MNEAVLRKHIQDFVRNASVEITPGIRNEINAFTDVMEPGRRVFITHLPGKPLDGLVDTAVALRGEGMEPVPHLGARNMTGPAQLYDVLEKLRSRADVRDVLLIGGSNGKQSGEFGSTVDMLETGYFQEFGLRSIGIAGHPEGHPEVCEDDIRSALEYKNEFAMHHNLHMYIVTQFTFESRFVLDWLNKIEAWGNQLPVNIGLPGPASLQRLMKFARVCEVGYSFRFLRRQGLKLLRAASVSIPDRAVTQLAAYCAQHPEHRITRAHFYNFGGLKKTMRFISLVEQGDFEIKPFFKGIALTESL